MDQEFKDDVLGWHISENSMENNCLVQNSENADLNGHQTVLLPETEIKRESEVLNGTTREQENICQIKNSQNDNLFEHQTVLSVETEVKQESEIKYLGGIVGQNENSLVQNPENVSLVYHQTVLPETVFKNELDILDRTVKENNCQAQINENVEFHTNLENQDVVSETKVETAFKFDVLDGIGREMETNSSVENSENITSPVVTYTIETPIKNEFDDLDESARESPIQNIETVSLVNLETVSPETTIKNEIDVLDGAVRQKESNCEVQNINNASLVNHETVLSETSIKEEVVVFNETVRENENNIKIQSVENVDLPSHVVSHQTALLNTEIKQEYQHKVVSDNSHDKNCHMESSVDIGLEANFMNHQAVTEVKQEREFEVVSGTVTRDDQENKQYAEETGIDTNFVNNQSVSLQTGVKNEFDIIVVQQQNNNDSVAQNCLENNCNNQHTREDTNLFNNQTVSQQTGVNDELDFIVIQQQNTSYIITQHSHENYSVNCNNQISRKDGNIVNDQTMSQSGVQEQSDFTVIKQQNTKDSVTQSSQENYCINQNKREDTYLINNQTVSQQTEVKGEFDFTVIQPQNTSDSVSPNYHQNSCNNRNTREDTDVVNNQTLSRQTGVKDEFDFESDGVNENSPNQTKQKAEIREDSDFETAHVIESVIENSHDRYCYNKNTEDIDVDTNFMHNQTLSQYTGFTDESENNTSGKSQEEKTDDSLGANLINNQIVSHNTGFEELDSVVTENSQVINIGSVTLPSFKVENDKTSHQDNQDSHTLLCMHKEENDVNLPAENSNNANQSINTNIADKMEVPPGFQMFRKFRNPDENSNKGNIIQTYINTNNSKEIEAPPGFKMIKLRNVLIGNSNLNDEGENYIPGNKLDTQSMNKVENQVNLPAENSNRVNNIQSTNTNIAEASQGFKMFRKTSNRGNNINTNNLDELEPPPGFRMVNVPIENFYHNDQGEDIPCNKLITVKSRVEKKSRGFTVKVPTNIVDTVNRLEGIGKVFLKYDTEPINVHPVCGNPNGTTCAPCTEPVQKQCVSVQVKQINPLQTESKNYTSGNAYLKNETTVLGPICGNPNITTCAPLAESVQTQCGNIQYIQINPSHAESINNNSGNVCWKNATTAVQVDQIFGNPNGTMCAPLTESVQKQCGSVQNKQINPLQAESRNYTSGNACLRNETTVLGPICGNPNSTPIAESVQKQCGSIQNYQIQTLSHVQGEYNNYATENVYLKVDALAVDHNYGNVNGTMCTPLSESCHNQCESSQNQQIQTSSQKDFNDYTTGNGCLKYDTEAIPKGTRCAPLTESVQNQCDSIQNIQIKTLSHTQQESDNYNTENACLKKETTDVDYNLGNLNGTTCAPLTTETVPKHTDSTCIQSKQMQNLSLMESNNVVTGKSRTEDVFVSKAEDESFVYFHRYLIEKRGKVNSYVCMICDLDLLFKKDLRQHTFSHKGDKNLLGYKKLYNRKKYYECLCCGHLLTCVRYIKAHIYTHMKELKQNRSSHLLSKYQNGNGENSSNKVGQPIGEVTVHTDDLVAKSEKEFTDIDLQYENPIGTMCAPSTTESVPNLNDSKCIQSKQMTSIESNNVATGNVRIVEMATGNVWNVDMVEDFFISRVEDGSSVYVHIYIIKRDKFKSYICTICDLELLFKKDMRQHTLSHKGDKNLLGYKKLWYMSYECLSCQEHFKNVGYVRLHICTHVEKLKQNIRSDLLSKDQNRNGENSSREAEKWIGKVAVLTDDLVTQKDVISGEEPTDKDDNYGNSNGTICAPLTECVQSIENNLLQTVSQTESNTSGNVSLKNDIEALDHYYGNPNGTMCASLTESATVCGQLTVPVPIIQNNLLQTVSQTESNTSGNVSLKNDIEALDNYYGNPNGTMCAPLTESLQNWYEIIQNQQTSQSVSKGYSTGNVCLKNNTEDAEPTSGNTNGTKCAPLNNHIHQIQTLPQTSTESYNYAMERVDLMYDTTAIDLYYGNPNGTMCAPPTTEYVPNITDSIQNNPIQPSSQTTSKPDDAMGNNEAIKPVYNNLNGTVWASLTESVPNSTVSVQNDPIQTSPQTIRNVFKDKVFISKAEIGPFVYFHKYIYLTKFRKLKCTICNIKLSNQKEAKLHTLTHKDDKNLFGFRKVLVDTGPCIAREHYYECLSCSERLTSIRTVKLHINEHMEEPVQGVENSVNITGPPMGSVCTPLTESNGNECDNVSQMQISSPMGSNTMGNVWTEKILVCEDKNNRIVYFHKYLTKFRLLKCTICDVEMFTEKEAKRHTLTHKSDKNLFGYRICLDGTSWKTCCECLSCGESFSKIYSINLHIRSHIDGSLQPGDPDNFDTGDLSDEEEAVCIREERIAIDHAYVRKRPAGWANLQLYTKQNQYGYGKSGRGHKRKKHHIWRRTTKQYSKDPTKTLLLECQNESGNRYDISGNLPPDSPYESADDLEDELQMETVTHESTAGGRRRKTVRFRYYKTSRDSDQEDKEVEEDPDYSPADNNDDLETESDSCATSSDDSSDENSMTSKRVKLSEEQDSLPVETEDEIGKTEGDLEDDDDHDEHLDESEEELEASVNVKNINMTKKYRRFKKYCCIYCIKGYVKLVKHLITLHSDEPEVQKALSSKKFTRARNERWRDLHYKCNFSFNMKTLEKGDGEIVPWSRIRVDKPLAPKEFYQCKDCFTTFRFKRFFNQHFKNGYCLNEVIEPPKENENSLLERSEVLENISATSQINLDGNSSSGSRVKDGDNKMNKTLSNEDQNDSGPFREPELASMDVENTTLVSEAACISSEHLNQLEATEKKGLSSSLTENNKKLNFFKEKNIFDKRHRCLYCSKRFAGIVEHLELKHSEEIDIQIVLSIVDKNSSARKAMLLQLIKKGDRKFHKSKEDTHVALSRNTEEKSLRKRHCCVFCGQHFIRIIQHFKFRHSDEEDVKKALSFIDKSNERTAIWNDLLTRGDNMGNLEKDQGEISGFKPNLDENIKVSDSVKCRDCYVKLSRLPSSVVESVKLSRLQSSAVELLNSVGLSQLPPVVVESVS